MDCEAAPSYTLIAVECLRRCLTMKKMKQRSSFAICIAAASLLAGCTDIARTVSGQPCLGATYESSECHINGTPVTEAEKAEGRKRQIEARRHLYTLFGDRTLTPMQIEAVRTGWNVRFCSSSVHTMTLTAKRVAKAWTRRNAYPTRLPPAWARVRAPLQGRPGSDGTVRTPAYPSQTC